MPNRIPTSFVRTLLADERPIPEKLALLASLRADEPDRSASLDRLLVECCSQLQQGLEEAKKKQGELRELLEKLTAPGA